MPDKAFPRARLKQLYVDNNKWSNVADLLKDQIKNTPDDSPEQLEGKIALHWELVELYRERLRQPGLVVTTLGGLEKLLDSAGETDALIKVVEEQQKQFESMKRWPDLIGRIRRRAELVQDMDARKDLHLQAGALFLDKFNNQAEAIKSYEAVLECDEYDPTAIGKLKELYQRRRDWEKMLAVQQKELALIEDPEERKAQLIEVARVAGQKIKKPAISIELWSQVLESDPDNIEALENLEHMQEREKNWPALSGTLERLIEVTTDPAKKSQYLVKLGLLYADKVKDNAAAIRTWEALHEVEPDNRRAQDQLKKLYVAEGDMDALEQFYAKQDKWAEFIRVLERESDTAEGERKVELQLKIAALYRDKIGKPDRAVRALEKALADGDNLTVAEKLIELYEEAGDERHLARPLRIKLDNEEEPEARQELFRRLADLSERIAHEPEEAFAYYQKALDEDHTATDAREHLERLAETTNQWEPLAQSLELAIKEYGDSTQSLPLRLKLAEIGELHMADLDAALAVNQAIVEIDAEEPTALASLERLYLALGREEDLLAVLDTKLSLSSDEEEKRTTQTRIGSIHEQLGHHDKAIEAYNAVLDSGIEDPEVLSALDRIYTNLERWEDLSGVLERELSVASDEDADVRAEYLLRLGVIMQDRLEKPDEAVELYRQVLEIDPASDSARDRLEGWLALPEADEESGELAEESVERTELRVKVAGILLPIYEAMEAHAEQVQCLQVQSDAAQDSQSRVDLLLRIGELLSHSMADSTRAFEVYARAFREQPDNEVAAQSLENIATVEDRWQDFADLHEEAVSTDLESGLMRRLLTRLATLYDQQLGDSEKSIACYQRAVDIDPGDAGSLDALEALYSRDQNWEQLLDVYRSKVELENDEPTREELRFKIAHLQVDMLSRPADGIVTYNEILADDDINTRAITALDRLYLEAEQWTELAENLSRQLALTADPSEQIELNLRLGSLQLRKLSQPALAVETYSRVLEFDPVNESALEALETLLDDEEHQLSVAKILEPIYKASNDWTKLIAAHEIMVKHSLEPGEKIQLLHQIGELYELAGDEPEKAFDAFGRALKEDPSREDTQARLDNLATQMGAFTEMVALYEGVVEDVVDDQLRLAILGKVARTYETAIDDSTSAAATYEKMLEADPANFEAVDSLIEVHRRTNSFEPLVAAVVRKAEMVEDTDDQKKMLSYAASIREGVMEDAEGAIELYQRVLTIDDTDGETLEALERLYVQLERWEPLRDVYQRKSELAEDPDDRRQALYVLGQVYDAELKDTDRAIDTYQAVLDIEPGDQQAIQALDRLYGQAERWLDQHQILERAVDAFDTAEEQTALRYRIGQLWETQLADMVRAIEAYREVLAHDPAHEPTIDALQRIAHSDNEPMAAAQVLGPRYEQFSEWEKLVEIYEVMVEHTEDPVGKIERLHQVAGIYELQLSEFDKAFDAYARALATDPKSELTVEQLERLAEVTGDWEKFAALLSEQADRLLDPHAKTQMLSRLARIQEERLANVEDAVGRYLEVLDNDPEDVAAIGALDRIFTHTEQWPQLVENLRRQVAITGDEHDLIALYFRMGQTYQVQMNESAKAIEAYREILNIDPAHEQTLQALELIFTSGEHQSEIAEILEPIYQAAERWDALVKLGEVKLGATEDQHERLSIIQNVAEICEHRLGSPGDAYIWWLRAYIDDPSSEQVHEELARLAELTGEWGHIVDVGGQILEEEQPPEVKQSVLMRTAKVLDERLMDGGRAIEAYRAVLELDAENAEALGALDRIYSQLGMAQDLAEVLQRRIRITMDGEELVDLEVRLAETFERDLHNAEQAVAAYTRALENDPANTTALGRLETLYLHQHKWEELFDVYQKTVDVANTDEDTADCYQRMAKLASDTLDR
ncbi:MAG: tetratricopeptide repeat protein, partial [Nannocystaceae bacterium]|nr:tetratricopeptide repeat protein [Nannocystaceae bacterium]